MTLNLTKFLINYKLHYEKFFIDDEYISRFFKDDEKLKLLKNKLLIRYDSEYCINFSHPKILELEKENSSKIIDESLYGEVLLIVNDLIKRYKSIKGIFIIGSSVRNVEKKPKDLDFVIISSRKIRKIKISNVKNLKKLDFVLYTTREYYDNFKKNNELILWTIKYGVNVYLKDFDYFNFKNLKKNTLFFDSIILKKEKQILKHINYLINFYQDLSVNSYLYYLRKIYFYIIRLYLFKSNIIPASKPELEEQYLKHNIESDLIKDIKLFLDETNEFRNDKRLLLICNEVKKILNLRNID